jgi:hypothetical protein
MPNIYKGDIGFKGQQAQIITAHNIGEDLNYSVNSGTLLLTDKKTGDMFSYVDEPEKLETYSAGRLKTSSPPLYCPDCAAQLIGFVRGKRKITIPFCPLCAPKNLENYSTLICNAGENNAIRHFEAEHSQGYDDRDDESIGMRHRGHHKQSLKDRRDESKGMTDHDDPHHPYSDVSTMSAEHSQGYDDRDDESIGMRHRGHHKQSMKDRRDESKGMTDHDDPHHPYSDVSTMSAELTGSQYYPVGEGHILGDITSDAQYTPLGSNAETMEEYEAYDEPITDRQEYAIRKLGGRLKNTRGMNRSQASDYIKDLKGKESGTWRAEGGKFNAQGYDDRDDESIGGRHRGKHKQSMKDRRDESKGMTDHDNPHHPYSDVSTMSAEYDSPYGERQTTVFGLVGGGNDFAQNRAESLMDTTSDEVMPFGVIGGGNDFGQNLAEDFGSEYHLTDAERNRLPKSDFAMPSERKYPMPNTYYAKKALTYAKWPNNRGDLREVERNVLAKYPSLDGWWSKHRPKNAETFGAESKGTNMWMMAAMAAVGFVAGISLKDMNTDIDSQES